VREIINRANGIIPVISGHTTATKSDLEKAEKIFQELKNIKDNGNNEEKAQLKS
jgi:hypothetical protein